MWITAMGSSPRLERWPDLTAAQNAENLVAASASGWMGFVSGYVRPVCVATSVSEWKLRCRRTDHLPLAHARSYDVFPIASPLAGVRSYQSLRCASTPRVPRSSQQSRNFLAIPAIERTFCAIPEPAELSRSSCQNLHALSLRFEAFASVLDSCQRNSAAERCALYFRRGDPGEWSRRRGDADQELLP